MPHPNETTAERDARHEHMDEADNRLRLNTSLSGVRPEFVDAGPISGYPGSAYVRIGGRRTYSGWQGSIAELRQVAQEIDRQLARLEVEHRIDTAVADDAEGEA